MLAIWAAALITPPSCSIWACRRPTSVRIGPYGVYHSVFDNFAWFTKFGDPTFVYEQEMARVYGLEAIRMASADVLPFDYEEYGKEIAEYVKAAETEIQERLRHAVAVVRRSCPGSGPAAEGRRRPAEGAEQFAGRSRQA